MSKLEEDIGRIIIEASAEAVQVCSVVVNEFYYTKQVMEVISKHMAECPEAEVPAVIESLGAEIETSFCMGRNIQRKLCEEHLKEGA